MLLIDETAELDIIHMALYALGALRPGEMPSVSDLSYVRLELHAILATLHLILAQRIALQYKVPLRPQLGPIASPIIATENASAPRRETSAKQRS